VPEKKPERNRLLRLLGAAKAGTPEAVHRLRTGIRRGEAVLDLGKEWKRLRRRAGRVRDLDAQMALLRALHLPPEPARRLLQARMEAERAREERKLADALDRKREQRLKRRALAAAVLPPSPGPGALAEDAAALARDFPQLDAGNLHAFRTACKRLRYRAEAAGSADLAGALKLVQDAIGAWHDARQLLERAQRMLAGKHAGVLLAALENQADAYTREALAAAHQARADAARGWSAAPPRRGPARSGPPLARARRRA